MSRVVPMSCARWCRGGGRGSERRRHYAGRLGRPRATDLTPRERTIAELVAKGLTQAEVARELGIVRADISSALERAKARIGVKHVWELVRYVRGGGRP